MRSFVLQKFMLDDIGALQWKLAPPLEGEAEKDDVDFNEMLAEIESYAQRIEGLAIEVNIGEKLRIQYVSLCLVGEQLEKCRENKKQRSATLLFCVACFSI